MEIILFILFVVASVVFRILQPRIKGYLGEKSVATILSLLPSDKYKIINDLLIEVDGRTIQIDHHPIIIQWNISIMVSQPCFITLNQWKNLFICYGIRISN